LYVAQWHPGVERDGDERVAQGVRSDGLGDPGPAGDAADDPPGAMAVQPAACSARLLDLAWLVESSGLRSSLGDLLGRLPARALSARLSDGAGPA
jgi:hypothetical protein